MSIVTLTLAMCQTQTIRRYRVIRSDVGMAAEMPEGVLMAAEAVTPCKAAGAHAGLVAGNSRQPSRRLCSGCPTVSNLADTGSGASMRN